MIRLAMLSLVVVALAGVEYNPTHQKPVLYTWTIFQSAQWKSAGDSLRYDTRIVWNLALRCAEIVGPRMTVAATFISVDATHRGPGTDIQVNSASGAGADDQLLGHVMDLAGKTLILEVERSSGQVVSVSGGDAIIAAINRRAPPTVPGDPPPLEAQAKVAYGPDALARLWTQILGLPGGEAQIALPAPFTSGTLKRSWTDLAWSVAQPAGPPPSFELAKDPTPVRGTVSKLSGSGSIALAAGMPAKATGKLSFVLTIDVMTQPVTTINEIGWELEAQ